MAKAPDPLDRAFGRIQSLIEIIAAERKRAVTNPRDQRWVDFGIVEAGADSKTAADMVEDFFYDIQLLLTHLALLDLASTFELEANKQLRTFVGAARIAVRASSKDKQSWRENVVKDKFEGLDEIFHLIGLDSENMRSAKLIRIARNNFSHGINLEKIPSITAEDAKLLLSRWLEMLP